MVAIEGLVLSVALPLVEERLRGERGLTYDDAGTLRLQLKPGPSIRAQLRHFLTHELPRHMCGKEKSKRKARFEGLFIDLSVVSIRVCFVGGERDVCFQGADDVRYARLQPLPALPGQVVYLTKDCPGCKTAWVDLVPPKVVDAALCRECAEAAVQEKREAAQMRQNRANFSSGSSAVDQRERSEVLRTWERYSLTSLERAIQLALHRYRMHCPYPAHDAERVVEWCQSHALHRFDYEDFIKEVTMILSGER